MTIKLTAENVRTLPARGEDCLYPDSDRRNGVPGLYLRVRRGGSRTFIIQWRQGSAQRRTTIGKVGVISLDEARRKARKTLVGIDEGHDPATLKARTRAEGEKIFLPLAEQYLAKRAGDMKPRSIEQTTHHLKVHWNGLHRLAVSRIDRAMVASELRNLAKSSGPIAADRARSALSTFYAWLIGEGYADLNPVVGTNKSGQGRSRDRILTDAELVAIWNATTETDYGRIVRLLMLTAQRRDEIADLRHSEIEETQRGQRQIALSPSRTKNSRPHDVPLSAPAWAIVERVPVRDDRAYMFGEGTRGYSGFSKAKLALDKACAVTGWTLHDLRRTAATRMADLGVLPHVIEAVLNHVSGHKAGVAGVYNRSTYAAEKRAALDLWAGHLMTILARAEGANVVAIRGL